MITGGEEYEENTGVRAFPTAMKGGISSLLQSFRRKEHPWSTAWAITGRFTPCTVTDPEQGKPDTSKSDAGRSETTMHEMSP